MARPAPSTVSRAGLISKGSMMLIPNRTSIPKECGPTFFNGNTDIFQVPDTCCTAAAGAEEWLPLSKFGSYKGIDGCKLVDPFDDGKIQAELVNGCYDDGTQYYGEKCGASDFGEATADAHGDCGPAEGVLERVAILGPRTCWYCRYRDHGHALHLPAKYEAKERPDYCKGDNDGGLEQKGRRC